MTEPPPDPPPSSRTRRLYTLLFAPPAFTCPRCGMESWNPNDAAEGYCGACHDWTGGEHPVTVPS